MCMRRNDITKERLEHDFFVCHLSQEQVAVKHSCSVSTIKRRRREHGIKLPSREGYCTRDNRRNDITKEQLEHDFFVEFLTQGQAAKKHGCDVSTIERYTKKYNIHLQGNHRRDITKEQLEYYFFTEALSLKQAAERYRCSAYTIRRRVKEYNIKLDPSIWSKGYMSPYLRKLLVQGVELTPRQESIVVGCVLGDGCLQVVNTNGNACLEFEQTYKRKGYVEWLREELQPFVPRPLAKYTGYAFGVESTSVRLGTVFHPEFTRFYSMFYPEGKKVVPENIGDYLGELALTVWYEGDGNTDGSTSTIATQSFTIPECELLLKVLHEKFDLEGHIRTITDKPDQPILYFRTKTGGHKRLHDIIDPLLHNTFEYKKRDTSLGPLQGERNNSAKLKEGEVKEIRRLYATGGYTYRELAKEFGVSRHTISNIIKYKSWKHVT